MEPQINTAAIAAAKEHALSEFPKESVGFITPVGYVPLDNTSVAPDTSFSVDAELWLDHKDAIALVHSHPQANAFDRRAFRPGFYPDCPSEWDMQTQLAMELPWGIIVTDGEAARDPFWFGEFVLRRQLLGRPFRHGVEDCYTAIRKWYLQKRKVVLPEFPRGPDWWEGDDPMYENGFEKAGFERMGSRPDLQPGDVGLLRVGGRIAKQVNHGFVWLGDGSVYHHLAGRLSRREAAGGRLERGVIWLRYTGGEDA